jgi:hypothetical protein
VVVGVGIVVVVVAGMVVVVGTVVGVSTDSIFIYIFLILKKMKDVVRYLEKKRSMNFFLK